MSLTDTFRTPEDHREVIAIDGPAAAGKSTVARLLADRLGALLFDTGVLYRIVALQALTSNTSPGDAVALRQIAESSRIEVRPPSQQDGRQYDVWLDGQDVTWRLREPDIGAIVSQVAEHPEVRSALLPLQRKIAAQGAVVMVGRDVGTIVVPDAGVKIYLDATPMERARRRYRELQERGGEQTFGEVLTETLHRDSVDSTRSTAPLTMASDAVLIQTDHRSIDDVVSEIEALTRERAAPVKRPS